MGMNFSFARSKSSGDWLPNMNVLNITELYMKMVKIVHFVLAVFYHIKKEKEY